MRVSALIGTRNRPEALLRCIRSLRAQRRPPDEIVVLDDASDRVDVPRTLAGVAGVRLIRSERRLGVGRGRNVLFAAATGDLFLVLDDDAWIDDQDFMVRLLEEVERRPAAAIIAARIVDHHVDGARLLVPFPRRAREADPSLADRAQRVSYFLGGAHAIRRSAWERAGGYDDDFVWGEEELDLSFRMIGAGYEIHYVPELLVDHRAEPPVLQALGERPGELYHHVRNRFVLARKFLPARFALPYLATWLARHASDAARTGDIAGYMRGIGTGITLLRRTRRERLNEPALRYLAAYHGRLWY